MDSSQEHKQSKKLQKCVHYVTINVKLFKKCKTISCLFTQIQKCKCNENLHSLQKPRPMLLASLHLMAQRWPLGGALWDPWHLLWGRRTGAGGQHGAESTCCFIGKGRKLLKLRDLHDQLCVLWTVNYLINIKTKKEKSQYQVKFHGHRDLILNLLHFLPQENIICGKQTTSV